jgi:hypothetical protein
MTGGTRNARWLLCAAAAVAAWSLGPETAAGDASERRLEPPEIGSELTRPVTAPVRDRVIREHPRPAAASRIIHGARSRILYTGDGTPISLDVSPSYVPDAAADQAFVNFIGGRLHGPELRELSVVIATPQEITQVFCGEDALACYKPAEERMYIAGEDTPGQAPLEYVITHEYAHHIEANRSNAPWSALNLGPKIWASYHRVCEQVADGSLGNDYLSDPAEGFAEAYAQKHYPGTVPWSYAPPLQPDSRSFEAIADDVLRPWVRRSVYKTRGSFRARGSSVRRYRVNTPLDGSALFVLRGPSRANYDLEVWSGRRRLGSARRSGSDEFVEFEQFCGFSNVEVVVKRKRGKGGFRLTTWVP